jgi:hypothetical protein
MYDAIGSVRGFLISEATFRRIESGIEVALSRGKYPKGVVSHMLKFYSAAGAAGSGLSSAVVVPIVMLVAVLTGVTGLVLGIGRRKARRGDSSRFDNSLTAEEHNRRTAL